MKVSRDIFLPVVHQNIRMGDVSSSSGVFGSTLTSIHELIYQRAQSPRDTTRYLFVFFLNLGLYDVYE